MQWRPKRHASSLCNKFARSWWVLPRLRRIQGWCRLRLSSIRQSWRSNLPWIIFLVLKMPAASYHGHGSSSIKLFVWLLSSSQYTRIFWKILSTDFRWSTLRRWVKMCGKIVGWLFCRQTVNSCEKTKIAPSVRHDIGIFASRSAPTET